MELYCERFGKGAPVLLLLHGLAGNGGVWQPLLGVLRDRWPGAIVVPDLRGHGRSPHGRHYNYGQHAADVAELLDADEHVNVVAHSMGAVVAATAASALFGLSIDSILGFGVKTGFSEAELEKMRSLAKMPVRWFDTRREAAERFLKLSGLAGLAAEDCAAVAAGVREENGRWRLAADPGIFSAAGGAGLEGVLGACKARLNLACGSEDQMVTVQQLRRYDPQALELPGLGHNLHVQAPEALAALMERAQL